MGELRAKAISAAIYPALVFAVGSAISLFLIFGVMPKFARIYQNLRSTSGHGSLTGALINVSTWASNHPSFVALTAIGFLATAAISIVSGVTHRFFHWLIKRVPIVRRRIRDLELSLMYQTLSLLTRGGYTVLESFSLASRSALSAEMRDLILSSSTEISLGKSVSAALAQAGLCDAVTQRLVAAAERNGALATAAEAVAQIYATRFRLFIERTSRVIEPILLLVVATMVGSIVVAMYMPVFQIAGQLR